MLARLLFVLLALLSCARSSRTALEPGGCIWRVRVGAAARPLIADDLWESGDESSAARACLLAAARGARCAGFALDSAPSFTLLSFDALHDTLHDVPGPAKRAEVWQHACWPLEGAVLALMTTTARPGNASYVRRAAASVAAEGLPLFLVDTGGSASAEASFEPEAARWAFQQPSGVRYVRAPTKLAELAAGPAGRGRPSQAAALAEWRTRETLHFSWALRRAAKLAAGRGGSYVLFMEDDCVLAKGAAAALARRLQPDALGGRVMRDAAVSAAASSALGRSMRLGKAPMPRLVPPAPQAAGMHPRLGWLALSLWSADALPDLHGCDNCYTKALVFTLPGAQTLASHARTRAREKPVDWLLADVEKAAGGGRRAILALVPNLAEHVGDQSSLVGLRREWQRSAYFKQHPFKPAGEEGVAGEAGRERDGAACEWGNGEALRRAREKAAESRCFLLVLPK